MSREVLLQVESGACNVCAAPCSSCMHINRVVMGSKTNEFSDEMSLVNMASPYSVNGGGVSTSFKRKACGSVQNTTSETSNLVSVNSNHGSLSENADSKANPRSLDINDPLEVDIHPKLSSGEDVEHVEQYTKGRACSIRCEDSQGAHDDNISCISRANDVYATENKNSRNADRKNLSCSSASVSSLDPKYPKKAQETILLDMPSSKHAISQISSEKEKIPAEFNLVDKEPLLKAAATDDSCGQTSASLKDSDVSPDIFLNSEAQTNYDGEKSTDKGFKCEQDGKSCEFTIQEPPLPSGADDESDESDIVEHDVKVCDICGEAGREDLLAICSRCSDGAEHTYCMQKMLKKVPRGKWLCEECKFAEETNNQKQVSQVEGRRTNKASPSTQFSGKRIADITEVAPVAKRSALETSVGSLESFSPVKPSRESSFKNLNRERLRPVQKTSLRNHLNDSEETPRSLTTTPRLQTSKGTLSKSNSFNTLNSKPKVKLVDGVVPLKQEGAKEQTSLDMMGRPARLISGKSKSFKSAILGRSNASDSKVKMLSPKELNHVLDLKGLKQPKERTVYERKTLTKIDRPPFSPTPAGSTVSTPRVDQPSHVEYSLTSSLSNNRDLKSVHCEGKPNSLSKSVNNLVRKPNVSVEVSSTNRGQTSATEHTLNHFCSKDESLSTCFLINERPRNNLDGTSRDGLPHSELTRENSVCRRSTATDCSEPVVGHAAEFGSIGGSQASGNDAFASKSSRDEMHHGSKLKDAIQAALLKKPELSRKKKVLEQSEELSLSNAEISCEAAPQNQVLVSSKLKSIMSAESSNEEEAVLGNSTPEFYTSSAGNSLMKHAVAVTDATFSSRMGDSDAAVSSLGKPMRKDILDLVSATSSLLLKISAIPEYRYIWQGCFKVHRSGNLLDLHDEIQAHLSTCASPKALEVAEMFPHYLSLHEVPRLSMWPAQFHETGAIDNNIALYFFAKDIESYERNYKSLVDGMIKNDLALKGQFDGVELLIFPSNQLPEKSRRWNMLFYLWGVFRGRKMHPSDLSKKLHIPTLGSVPVEKHLPSAVMTNLCYLERVHEKSPASDTVSNQASEKVISDCEDRKSPAEQLPMSSEANTMLQDGRFYSNLTCHASSGEERRGNSPSLDEVIFPNQRLGMEFKPPFLAIASNSYSKGEKTELHCDTCNDRKDTSSLNILPVSNQELGVAMSFYEEKISNGNERNPDGLSEDRDHYKANKEVKDGEYLSTPASLARNLTSQGNISFQFNPNKSSHIDLLDTAPSASIVKHEKMPWSETNVLGDGVIISKKPKIGLKSIYGCSTSEEEKICVETCDEKVILEDFGTSERYLFPVNLFQRSGDNSVTRKSFPAEGEGFNDGFPNLELALGADIKPQNKGRLPFFVGSVNKSDNEDKPPDKVIDNKEDDASASLSLSLSFPFPDKEEVIKPVSKPDQLRPEKHPANTPLLLFGGLCNK